MWRSERKIREDAESTVKNGPLSLFRYLRLDREDRIDWTKNIFERQEVYFASPEQFHTGDQGDPLDCRPNVDFDAPLEIKREKVIGFAPKAILLLTPEEINNWADRKCAQIEEDWRANPYHVVENHAIFCLTTTNINKHMWIGYADQFRGICIEFSCTNDSHLDFFAPSHKVTYTDSEAPPYVNIYTMDKGEISDRLVLTKTSRWKEEKEWRIIDLKGGPGPRKFPHDLLASVTFGYQTPPDIRNLVLGWVSRYPSPLTVNIIERDQNTGLLRIAPFVST